MQEIKLADMDLQTKKLDVMHKVMEISNMSLLNKISDILDKEMTVGYTADGQALSKKMYNQRLQYAEKQLLSGDCISQEDLEKESDNW